MYIQQRGRNEPKGKRNYCYIERRLTQISKENKTKKMKHKKKLRLNCSTY